MYQIKHCFTSNWDETTVVQKLQRSREEAEGQILKPIQAYFKGLYQQN